MKHAARILLAILLLQPFAFARAVEVEGLYEAEVAVAGQDLVTRTDAMRVALAEVLVKVSGNRNVGTVAGIADLINNAPQYVQQYVYRNAPVPPGQRPTSPPARNLWVRFDRDGLNKLLRQAGIGIWGRARPALVLWLDMPEQKQRAILGADSRPEWKQFIDQIAKMRGVPIILPTLDAQDQAALAATDVWTSPADGVMQVSARYAAEAVIVARVESSDMTWSGNWILFEHDGQRTWTTAAESRDAAVLDGLQEAIDAVAERYTAGGSSDDTLLHVTDIRSLEDYARITKYLSSLAAVEKIQLMRIEGAAMIFRVDAQGGMQRLANDIRLGTTLAAEVTDPNAAPTDMMHRFRLQR